MPPSHPFRVGVTDLLHRPGARKREHLEAPLADLAVTGSHVIDDSPITVDVLLEAVHDGVLATGTITAEWAGDCRRCLNPATGELHTDFRELFDERPTEGDSYPLSHEQVDLEPLARETVLLELPQAPLCRDDCLGLCARCGTDLNEGSCDCEPEPDPRWAALDALRIDQD